MNNGTTRDTTATGAHAGNTTYTQTAYLQGNELEPPRLNRKARRAAAAQARKQRAITPR